MTARQKVNVCVKDGEEPLHLEVLQNEIIKLANVGKQIEKSKLTQRAIILLLHDITKLPQRNIQYVLNALPALADKYIKK